MEIGSLQCQERRRQRFGFLRWWEMREMAGEILQCQTIFCNRNVKERESTRKGLEATVKEVWSSAHLPLHSSKNQGEPCFVCCTFRGKNWSPRFTTYTRSLGKLVTIYFYGLRLQALKVLSDISQGHPTRKFYQNTWNIIFSFLRFCQSLRHICVS